MRSALGWLLRAGLFFAVAFFAGDLGKRLAGEVARVAGNSPAEQHALFGEVAFPAIFAFAWLGGLALGRLKPPPGNSALMAGGTAYLLKGLLPLFLASGTALFSGNGPLIVAITGGVTIVVALAAALGVRFVELVGLVAGLTRRPPPVPAQETAERHEAIVIPTSPKPRIRPPLIRLPSVTNGIGQGVATILAVIGSRAVRVAVLCILASIAVIAIPGSLVFADEGRFRWMLAPLGAVATAGLAGCLAARWAMRSRRAARAASEAVGQRLATLFRDAGAEEPAAR